MQVRCAVNSPYIYTFLPESLPADGNVEPGQLKDLNFLQCVVKVCWTQSVDQFIIMNSGKILKYFRKTISTPHQAKAI
jgi:hypothetical protein